MASDEKLKELQRLLDSAEANLKSARDILNNQIGEADTGKQPNNREDRGKNLSAPQTGKIVEGIFDGEQMVAPDGKKYPVPANYASKSKLVEGDTLKLTISEQGNFTYKQIKPTARKKIIGTLSQENGEHFVYADGKNYKVLLASVSFYGGKAGDRAAIVVPEDGNSVWAAMEGIVHDHEAQKEAGEAEHAEIPSPDGAEAHLSSEPISENKPEPSANLSQENEAILENLRQSLVHHEESNVIPPEEPEMPEKKPETEPQKEENENNQNQEEYTNQLQQSTPPPEPPEEHYDENGNPKIISHQTYVPSEEDSLVEEQTEQNSMGEEIAKPYPADKAIEEMEI